jgi:nucleotide-binding universal stress UspA family protein
MKVSETGDAGDQFLRRLVVGVDGSDGSRSAMTWTARLAKSTDAEILAVHVLTYNQEFLRDLSLDTLRTWRRDLRGELETGWTDPLRAAGVGYRCLLVEDDSPAGGLLAVAVREQADVLVVGTRGRGTMAGRVLGGVSYRLLHHADRPVVVVPLDRARSDST